MKLHIVFELDVSPESGLGDVAALTGLAAESFKKAVEPLGPCRMIKLRAAPLERELPPEADALESYVDDEPSGGPP